MLPDLDIQQIIDDLKESPLFNLAIESKELFHSKFLAWICEHYPQIAGEIFAEFLNSKISSDQICKVERENKNFNLKLTYKSGEILFIENHVKNIRYLQELQHYNNFNSENNVLLLSLIEPFFLEDNYHKQTQEILINKDNQTIIWHYLSYENLSQKLKNIQLRISQENIHHGQLLLHYINFIMCLHSLQSFFKINWDRSIPLYNSNIDKLKTTWLYDVMIGFWHLQLEKRLKQRLQEIELITNTSGQIQAGEIILDSEESLLSFKYCIKITSSYRIGEEGCPVFLGIEILPGNKHYLFIILFEFIITKIARKVVEKLFVPVEQVKIWFDLSHVPGNSEEYPNHSKYENNEDKFYFADTSFYRQKKLEANTSVNDLINLIIKYAGLIKDNEKEIIKIIDEVLDS